MVTSRDWHPADIYAAIKKRGLSLSGLSTDNGYHPTAAGKALKQPWPKIERIIAAACTYASMKSVPSRSMACMMMASRRARATFALRMEERLAIP